MNVDAYLARLGWTIQGSRLIVSTSTGRVERELSDEELRSAYRDHFGIVLNRLP